MQAQRAAEGIFQGKRNGDRQGHLPPSAHFVPSCVPQKAVTTRLVLPVLQQCPAKVERKA